MMDNYDNFMMDNYDNLRLNSFMRILKKYNDYDTISSITLKKSSNGEITRLNDLSIRKFKLVVSKMNIRWYWVLSACVCGVLNNNTIITLPQPTSPFVKNHKEIHVAVRPRLTLVKKREKTPVVGFPQSTSPFAEDTPVVTLPQSTSPYASKNSRKNSLVLKGGCRRKR